MTTTFAAFTSIAGDVVRTCPVTVGLWHSCGHISTKDRKANPIGCIDPRELSPEFVYCAGFIGGRLAHGAFLEGLEGYARGRQNGLIELARS